MRYLIPLFIAVSAYAGVDGTVINGTTDKPQPGATVTLFQTTSEGPKDLGSVKTGPDGKYNFDQNVQPGQGGGPLLLQAVYNGVQYNKVIAPGFPMSAVQIPVFEVSKTPSDETKIAQHVMIFEPSATGQIRVSETYVFRNEGKTTWNDPDKGTLQFYLPPESQGKVELNVLAPGGMPIRRAPDPGPKPNTYKLDFPVKPGDSRVDMVWTMPFKTPGAFEGKLLSKATMTNLVTPDGVTLKGDDVEQAGQEPTLKANIYKVKGSEFKVVIEGVGAIKNESDDQQQPQGSPGISENLPKLYSLAKGDATMLESLNAVKWVLGTIIGMLALGFILLYRKGDPNHESRRG
jgi:hypothetical protein